MIKEQERCCSEPFEVVRVLPAQEIRGRAEVARWMRLQAAGLPAGKTFGAGASPTLPFHRHPDWLATLKRVSTPENLSIAGASGSGKTHFAESLAHELLGAGVRVS